MLEWVATVLATIVAVWLHVGFAENAGGLWRDEANTVRLAAMPTLRDVWQNLEFDSFPILWVLIVRSLGSIGISSDQELRVVGCIVGLGVVAAIWFNARALRARLPLLTLPLVALCPSIVVWGDSMRAYGLGLCLILLTIGLVWRFVDEPTTPRYLLAALAAVGSVHAVYTNSVLLLAICLGAASVAARRKAWRSAALVLSIGFVAALSLLPYLPAMRRAAVWNELVRLPSFEPGTFWAKVSQTLPSPAMSWAWIFLLVMAIVLGALPQLRLRFFAVSEKSRDVALFGLVTMLVGAVALYAFLKLLRYPTEPWYYLAFIALLGTAIEAIFGATLGSRTAGRIVMLCVGIVLGALAINVAARSSSPRMTNVDLIAHELHQVASNGDLVVVCPWYYGVTFHRYVDPSVHWATVPDIESGGLCRYDLIKEKMMCADQSEPVRRVLERIEKALRDGRRVFVIGRIGILEPRFETSPIPPAPHAPSGWSDRPYLYAWETRFVQYLEEHAARRQPLNLPTGLIASEYEDLLVFAAEGWRD